LRLQRARVAAEHPEQLVVHDLHERLAGIETAGDFLAERPVAHALDERLGDGQRDVRFEQRHSYRPHGVADVLFGDAAAAGHTLERLREASRELIEH